MKSVATPILVCGLLFLSTATAQNRPAPADPVSPKPTHRAHYAVKNGDAALLAEVVGKHFQGDAVAVAANGTVLVSGTSGGVADAVKLLEQLDAKPRTIEVEIVIAELSAVKNGAEPSAADLIKEATDKAAGQRIKLTATEGQPLTSVTGGNKPYLSGSTVTAKGALQKSVSYQPVGTTVKMTARVGADDGVALALDLKDSRIKPPEAGDEGGAAAFENGTLTTTLNVPAGRAVIAQAVRSEGKTGPVLSVVIVTARVVGSGRP